jgi:hypothetical protein
VTRPAESTVAVDAPRCALVVVVRLFRAVTLFRRMTIAVRRSTRHIDLCGHLLGHADRSQMSECCVERQMRMLACSPSRRSLLHRAFVPFVTSTSNAIARHQSRLCTELDDVETGVVVRDTD